MKSSLNLEHFQEKMTFTADVFLKLRTPENMVRSIPKKSRFRGSVEKQQAECAPTLFKLEGHPLYHIYLSMGRQLSYKKSLLVICKISKLFPNTVSADGKYCLLDRDNLRQRSHMELSQKQKFFSEFFSSFLESSLNFEHFEKKIALIADVFRKLGTPKNMIR